jgi:hypothetical protein
MPFPAARTLARGACRDCHEFAFSAARWGLVPASFGLSFSDTRPCRKLDSAVFMMKSAEDGPRGDVAEPSNRTSTRCVLCQSEMRPEMVVVGCIDLEHVTQVGLAKEDDMIQAFPADRADEPLRIPNPPG